MTQLDLELYKILKAESAAYHGKLQKLWLQKLTLSGATVAGIFAFPAKLDSINLDFPLLAAAALVLLLAITIDVKVLEYGLHLRAISRFLARKLPARSVAADWEKALWGEQSHAERYLAQSRSALTVLSAAMPTLALLAIVTVLFSRRCDPWHVMPIAAIIATCYLGALGVSSWWLFCVANKPASGDEQSGRMAR